MGVYFFEGTLAVLDKVLVGRRSFGCELSVMVGAIFDYVEGDVYYFVLFVDRDLRIPIVRTLEYSKRGRRADGSEVLMFKNRDSDSSDRTIVFDPREANEVVLTGPLLLQRLSLAFDAPISSR